MLQGDRHKHGRFFFFSINSFNISIQGVLERAEISAEGAVNYNLEGLVLEHGRFFLIPPGLSSRHRRGHFGGCRDPVIQPHGVSSPAIRGRGREARCLLFCRCFPSRITAFGSFLIFAKIIQTGSDAAPIGGARISKLV